MAIPATQLRPGMIIKHNDQLHVVFKVEHRTPGNLRAFIQAKLRNLKSGAMFEHRFRSADAIEKVVVDEIPMEFLYADGDDYYFMNPVDYEQTVLKSATLGDAVEYLTANLQIKVSYFDGQPVGIELPQTVDLEVVETEPGLKSATASSVTKPAKTETGLVVQVPPFINAGRKDPRGHQRRRLPEPRVRHRSAQTRRSTCPFPQSLQPPQRTIASTPISSSKWSGPFAGRMAEPSQREIEPHRVDRGPRHLDAQAAACPSGDGVVAAVARLVRARRQVRAMERLSLARRAAGCMARGLRRAGRRAWKRLRGGFVAALHQGSSQPRRQVSGIVNFLAIHETYHVGQASYLRGWLGHKGLMG